MGRTLRSVVVGAAAAALFAGTMAEAASTYLPVTKNDENGWLFGRDPGNVADWEFQLGEGTLGNGSLFVGPIGATGSNKFVGESFGLAATPMSDIASVTFDYKVDSYGAAGTLNAAASDFYLNINVILPGTGQTYYDCNYAVLDDDAPTTGWATADGVPFLWNDRTGGDCPDLMTDLPDGSTLAFLQLNLGDTSTNDEGVSGWFDNVRVTFASGDVVAYNFDVPLAIKDACKDGGWQWYGFVNQGDCVSSLQANERAGK